ncbi:MAG: SDR family NAD(P)-dependent oxidoreductase, partial [Nocardiopsaceae bacterium]|nr:SDR family NAD(P)-dependent oxidoreductase [Nocardiopsaceae bacterium]
AGRGPASATPIAPASPEDGSSPEAAGKALGLTSESVIVLVGGARGITSWFAREAAAAAPGCRIELIGRSQLPSEPVTADIAGAPDAAAIRAALARQGMKSPAEIGRVTRTILARREIESTLADLRDLGARPRYHCADAADDEEMRRILKIVYEEGGGRIDGLVYSAGVIEDHLIRDKEPASFDRVFAAKTVGAKNTLAAVADQGATPAFTVLYGSIAATFGSRGQVDYAAANDALESLGASWARRSGRRFLTVHWGPWAPAGAHPGMVTPELARQYGHRGISLIDPREGARALLRELAWGDPALTSVVYTAPLGDDS